MGFRFSRRIKIGPGLRPGVSHSQTQRNGTGAGEAVMLVLVGFALFWLFWLFF